MDRFTLVFIWVCLLVSVSGVSPATQGDCSDVKTWLERTNIQALRHETAVATSEWNFATNITGTNSQQHTDDLTERNAFLKSIGNNITKLDTQECDDDTKRQLKLYQRYSSPKQRGQQTELVNVQGKMSKIYATAKACRSTNGQCLSLNPELTTILSETNDVKEMEWVWQAWRDVTGRPSRNMYSEYIDLSNKAAQVNGYADAGLYWRSEFETQGIEKVADKLIKKVRPMYIQLFTYVRRKLIEKYGNDSGIKEGGPIPAHLFGNMWAENWDSLINKGVVPPFPDVAGSDVTEELIKQKKTVTDLVKIAEDFFTSIGLFPMTDDFWSKSMFAKPEGRRVSCRSATYDFFGETDFRLKMCSQVTHYWLREIHHNMADIQYYMAYRNQPFIYRKSPNSAFQEAIGDMIILSVDTVPHLKTIGLIDNSKVTAEQRYQQDINFLMRHALSLIPSLLYGYIVDKTRWEMFKGNIPEKSYNHKWWEMRLKYQGLVPPVTRSESDFDMGANFNVLKDHPYLKFLIGGIVQFQFYEAMCREAKHVGPLHTCDFYQSKAAGRKLKNMLQMGSSRPWPDAMEAMTGQRDISAAAIIEYFKPLTDWLKDQNKKEKTVGWMKCRKPLKPIIDKYFE